jgi:hypothetical protein
MTWRAGTLPWLTLTVLKMPLSRPLKQSPPRRNRNAPKHWQWCAAALSLWQQQLVLRGRRWRMINLLLG